MLMPAFQALSLNLTFDMEMCFFPVCCRGDCLAVWFSHGWYSAVHWNSIACRQLALWSPLFPPSAVLLLRNCLSLLRLWSWNDTVSVCVLLCVPAAFCWRLPQVLSTQLWLNHVANHLLYVVMCCHDNGWLPQAVAISCTPLLLWQTTVLWQCHPIVLFLSLWLAGDHPWGDCWPQCGRTFSHDIPVPVS